MKLEKYDFESIHKFLIELVQVIDVETKGKLHLTTILYKDKASPIGLAGTNLKKMTHTVNMTLKKLTLVSQEQGEKVDPDVIETILDNDFKNNKELTKLIADTILHEQLDPTLEPDPFQSILNKLMKKH